MSYPMRTRYLGAIPNIAAGQRAPINLANGMRTFWLDVIIRCTATVAGGAVANLRNLGSAASIFSEIGILEDGSADWVLPGMMHLYSSALVAAQAPPGVSGIIPSQRMGTANGAYALVEVVRLWFALPYAANPEETAYIETNVQRPLQAFVTLSPLALAGGTLATLGAGTVTVSAVTVDVVQHFDEARDRRAIYRPSARFSPLAITSAAPGAEIELPIVTTKKMRSLGFVQWSPEVGILNDVINSAAFVGARQSPVGPGLVPWRDLTLGMPFAYGGEVNGGGFGTTPAGDAFFALNLQPFGRLGLTWDPNDDTNWRARFNAQVTAAAGATTTQIYALLYELGVVPGVTVESGRFRS